MTIDDIILLVLLSWAVPLALFTFYFVTDPVRGTRFRRRFIDLRTLTTVSKILLAQKVAFLSVVVFIGIVRFTGGFPGREFVALVLYSLLVILAWLVFADLRAMQLPGERKVRADDDLVDIEQNTTRNPEKTHEHQ